MSFAGGPVGNGLGRFNCLPLFLAKRETECFPVGACARKAKVPAFAMRHSAAMVMKCFMVMVWWELLGAQMNCETERMEVRRGLSLVAPGVMASPKQKNALSLMA